MCRLCRITMCMLCVAAVSTLSACPARAAAAPKPPDRTHSTSAEALLEQIWRADPGQPKFDAIDAVVREYKDSDDATKNAITWLCLVYMKDQSRGVLDRWPCCYVISRCGYDEGVPDLIDVLLHDPVEAMRAVAAEALGGMSSNTAAHEALLGAVSTETSQRVRDVLARYLGRDLVDPGPGAPDEAHRKAADALLRQVWLASPGQPKFDAINAVVKKVKAADAATRYATMWLALATMKDKDRAVLDRWPCCYVLSRSGYQQAVPDLIEVLDHDGVEAMRAVAAEALGGMYKDTDSAAIYNALMQAARTETSKWVRETLARYLGDDMPAPDASSQP